MSTLIRFARAPRALNQALLYQNAFSTKSSLASIVPLLQKRTPFSTTSRRKHLEGNEKKMDEIEVVKGAHTQESQGAERTQAGTEGLSVETAAEAEEREKADVISRLVEKGVVDWTHEDIDEAIKLKDQGWEEKKIVEKIQKGVKWRKRTESWTSWGKMGLLAWIFS